MDLHIGGLGDKNWGTSKKIWEMMPIFKNKEESFVSTVAPKWGWLTPMWTKCLELNYTVRFNYNLAKSRPGFLHVSCRFIDLTRSQFGIDSFYLAAYMQEKLMSLFLLFLQESCKNLGHCSTWDICFYGLCDVCHSNSPAMQKPNQRCFTFSTFSRLTTHTVVGVNL